MNKKRYLCVKTCTFPVDGSKKSKAIKFDARFEDILEVDLDDPDLMEVPKHFKEIGPDLETEAERLQREIDSLKEAMAAVLAQKETEAEPEEAVEEQPREEAPVEDVILDAMTVEVPQPERPVEPTKEEIAKVIASYAGDKEAMLAKVKEALPGATSRWSEKALAAQLIKQGLYQAAHN